MEFGPQVTYGDVPSQKLKCDIDDGSPDARPALHGPQKDIELVGHVGKLRQRNRFVMNAFEKDIEYAVPEGANLLVRLRSWGHIFKWAFLK